MLPTARLGGALVATMLWACGQGGGVHVAIELPADAALSPLSLGMARLDLRAEAAGLELATVSRSVATDPRGQSIGFGDLAITPGVRLTLLGYTASGRLVGFGRASAPVDVKAGSDVAVPVRLRRPFAYVAGGANLLACDTTVEPGATFAASVGAAASVDAVATTPDGAEILAVAGGQLLILSTARHQPTGAPASPIAAGATEIAVSPDSRWAVVVHAADRQPTGVSIVDLEAARAHTTAPRFVALDAPGGVAVGRDQAWVLVHPATSGLDECTQQSKLVPLGLADGATGAPVSLAGAARDLALADDGKTLFVAEPCQNAIVTVTGGGASQVKLVGMPGPTQVAVAGARVWGLGRDSAPSEHLVLTSVNVDGTNPTPLDLAATQELAKSNDLTEPGQTTEVRLDADRIEAYSLSVLPDGRNVVLLVHGTYHADEVVRRLSVGGVMFDEAIVPAMDMETYEYQLVDVTTGAATQRLRTSCKIDWDKGVAVLDDWDCASAQGQVTSSEDFIATQATVLYGAR